MPAPMLSNNYQVQNIFLDRIKLTSGTYTNNTGSSITLAPGTVMGKVINTNNSNVAGAVDTTISTHTDGAQIPRYLLYTAGDSITVANGASVTVQLCYAGNINQGGIVFQNGTDTLTTLVGTLGYMVDLLIANASEMVLYNSTELSNYDN